MNSFYYSLITSFYKRGVLFHIQNSQITNNSLEFIIHSKYLKFTYLIKSLSSFFSSSIILLELTAYHCLLTKELIIVNIFQYLSKTIKTSIFYSRISNQVSSSGESFFFNLWWLEREASEFFGLTFSFKRDTRRLLLEYNSTNNPLLKYYPSFGWNELYYNYFYSSFNQNTVSLQY